jgi:hypothetical protein
MLRHVKVVVCKNSKAQYCVTQPLRGSFTAQFTHMLRGKIASAPNSFRHIKA